MWEVDLNSEAAYVPVLDLPFPGLAVPSVFSVLSLLGGGSLQFSSHRVVHLKYVEKILRPQSVDR